MISIQTQGTALVELDSAPASLERGLQTQFERNLGTLLGVRFLASEYVTSHSGRMDTLGLDENGYPVIIEYKRDRSENVINQGLFYLDWLMDHRGDFELLVRDRYGKEAADQIKWSAPKLIRYRRFGSDLLLLEQLTSVSTSPALPALDPVTGVAKVNKYKTVSDMMSEAGSDLANLYAEVETYLLGLGDDVTKKTLCFYFAFRRIKNFACVEVKTTLNLVRLYLKIDPDTVQLEEGFSRDVRHVGHFGTGDLELTLKSHANLERAKPLIERSYEAC